MDLSVVIASFADPLGLYLTTFAAIEQLSKTKLEWEIILACDGGTPYKYEKQVGVRVLRIRTGSPQGTRDAGIKAAKSANVAVIESHVIVSDFACFLEMHKELGGAMTFPNRIAEGPEMFSVYGTETDFDGNLWFNKILYAPPSGKPRRVVQFGHSCFMIDKNAYETIGGYTDLLTGWGFEEPLLCLRFWMLGYECWQVPNVWHAHYLADRGAGNAMASDAFKKNAQIVKYVLTGQVTGGLQTTLPMQQERDKVCAGPFQGNLNSLKEYFTQEKIIS